MSSPNSIIPHRGTPASARSATSSNRGVSFMLPSPDDLAHPPSNNRIAADSIDPSVDDGFVRAIDAHSVAPPQALLLTPSSATSSNPVVSFTLPSPDAFASPPSNNHIAVDPVDPSGVDHFVRAIARHSVASPQAVLPTPSNERSAPYNKRANGIAKVTYSVGLHPSTLSKASITTSCVDATVVHRVSPTLIPFADIPSFRISILRGLIKDAFRIEHPREYQIEAINHLASNDDTYLVLVRKTADGKSLVPLTVALLRPGISITLVPLHGLGSDQVEKSNIPELGVEAYYVDEHKRSDAGALRKRLLSLTKEELHHTTCILFVSPFALASDSHWYTDVFTTLAKRGLISLFCIDEAHSIEQAGRAFRTEFVEAAINGHKLIQLMPTPVPRIIMSATLRQNDEDSVSKLFDNMTPNVMHGSLARRGTIFSCFVSGQSTTTLKHSAEEFLKSAPTKQQIWYSNSKHKAEGAMLDAAEIMLEKHFKFGHAKTICHSFTGGDGLMMKSATMDAFTSYASIDGSAESLLPKIQILTATSSANCGISSNDLDNALHEGLPPSLYELLQEMGRVNRKLSAIPGECHYEVHISFSSCISLYIRIMSNEDSMERKRLLAEMMLVLKLLMNSEECYHSALENYFERECVPNKPRCEIFCSSCDGTISKMTGLFHQRPLMSILATNMTQTKPLTPKALLKLLKQNKTTIFHSAHVPNKKTGQFHALAIQLLAKGIIGLEVTDTSKLGTNKLTADHLGITLPNVMDSDGLMLPAYMIKNSYKYLTCVECN